jgi:hypothetical protein
VNAIYIGGRMRMIVPIAAVSGRAGRKQVTELGLDDGITTFRRRDFGSLVLIAEG